MMQLSPCVQYNKAEVKAQDIDIIIRAKHYVAVLDIFCAECANILRIGQMSRSI